VGEMTRAGGIWPLGNPSRGRMVGRVPVVPGPEMVNAPTPAYPPCDACGYGDRNGVLRVRRCVDGVRLVLCVDYAACCARWRS
jgi:hypothetical protein